MAKRTKMQVAKDRAYDDLVTFVMDNAYAYGDIPADRKVILKRILKAVLATDIKDMKKYTTAED